MIESFRARIGRGPLQLDAAMGTRLMARGLVLATDDPCLWNLAHPEVVATIHRLDVAAGAEAVFTNTFGANRAWLGRFGRSSSVAAINRVAVALARHATGPAGYVIGSIGPTAAGDDQALLEQVDALLDAGVDALVLETFRADQAEAALRHRPVDRWVQRQEPVLVGLYDWPPGPVVPTAWRLLDRGATLVGANCFVDPAVADRVIDAFEREPGRSFWLKPGAGWAGTPGKTGTDFAHLAARLARINKGLLGGCCGTTEAHLRLIQQEWSRSPQLGDGQLAPGTPQMYTRPQLD